MLCKEITMAEKITWITTPKSCKDCDHYDKARKTCKLKVCRYPARR